MSLCKKSDLINWQAKGIFDLLNIELKLHRKYWEMGFLINSLIENNLLQKNNKGIVFGCGQEPTIPALANLGLKVTISDQPKSTGKNSGWDMTKQYCHGLEVFDKYTFPKENISYKEINMNEIPNISGYDFLWSLCSLEHLGSIENSFKFVINSMNVLKPGGLAIHTTEFNFKEDVFRDDFQNCVFSKSLLEKLFYYLKGHGHNPYKLNFDMGDSLEDHHIDKQPFSDSLHLKLFAEGYYITSIGFIIKSNEKKLL